MDEPPLFSILQNTFHGKVRRRGLLCDTLRSSCSSDLMRTLLAVRARDSHIVPFHDEYAPRQSNYNCIRDAI